MSASEMGFKQTLETTKRGGWVDVRLRVRGHIGAAQMRKWLKRKQSRQSTGFQGRR